MPIRRIIHSLHPPLLNFFLLRQTSIIAALAFEADHETTGAPWFFGGLRRRGRGSRDGFEIFGRDRGKREWKKEVSEISQW
jgi:hypothetical protein